MVVFNEQMQMGLSCMPTSNVGTEREPTAGVESFLFVQRVAWTLRSILRRMNSIFKRASS